MNYMEWYIIKLLINEFVFIYQEIISIAWIECKNQIIDRSKIRVYEKEMTTIRI